MASVSIRMNPQTESFQLSYAEHKGAEPPLILLHGAGSSRLGWPSELRRLQGQRVIALDWPAHGRSGGTGYQKVADYSAVLHEFMLGLGLERAILIGHSMGGAVAQYHALEHPEQVAGLILMGTGAHLPVNPDLLQLFSENPAQAAANISKWLWGIDATDEQRERDKAALLSLPPSVLYGDYVACAAFDVRKRLGEISAPTLVMAGALDKMTPFSLSEFLAAQIPQASLVKIENAGHWVMLEQAQQVAERIKAWLTTQANLNNL